MKSTDKISISNLAYMTGKSRETVAKKLKDLPFEKSNSARTGAKMYPVAVALEALYKPADVAEIDLATERALLARAQREGQEFKNQMQTASVIEAADVEQAVAEMGSRIGALLDSIPQKMKRSNANLTANDIEVARKIIVKVMNECCKVEL